MTISDLVAAVFLNYYGYLGRVDLSSIIFSKKLAYKHTMPR